jgi:hypothetical protein
MAGTIVIDTVQSSLSTPPVFKNTSGTEVGQLARAWVNFNGVTTASIRASFNVSSVTRTAGGIYTVAFTNSLPDTNFTVVGSARITGQSGILMPYPDNVLTTSSVSVTSLVSNTGVSTDAAYVYIAIFR